MDTVTSTLTAAFVAVISLLPQGGTFDSSFHESALTLGTYMRTLSPVLPINDLIFCISFMFTIRLVVLAIDIAFKLLYFIRGGTYFRIGKERAF